MLMKKSHDDDITNKLKQLTDSPGVYLMKDAELAVIYIGKARNLKKRVSSYFQKKDHDIKTRTLVNQIHDFDIFVTATEIEALILEDQLIKKHKPRYNVRLKDDKRYPYIAVTYSEDIPRVIFTRNVQNKKDRYFGPYTDAKAARNTIRLINMIFRLKTCTKKLPLKNGERPCLNAQINRCSGICENRITTEEYLSLVKSAEKFLKGNINPVIDDLTEKMNSHSQNTNFERAAQIRDIIFDIQQISEKQSVSSSKNYDIDYIALDVFREEAIVLLFEYRKGILLGKKIRVYENSAYSEKKDILQTFIIHTYSENEIPHIIITQYKISEEELLSSHLASKRARRVEIRTAKSQEERGAISLLTRNIDTIIAEKLALEEYSDKNRYLVNLKSMLSLPVVPVHIVCFDISNFQGTDAVASMASFKYGQPDKENYRRFKIRGYTEANDPGMIHEGVARYLANVVNEGWDKPDLIVIDGGPTQLAKAIEARDAFEIDIPLISIAKKLEEIYTEAHPEPYRIPHDSQELKIIQRVRDATHDFGVSYHRKLRKKRTLTSALDEIPGIGPKKRAALLAYFGSVEKVKEADSQTLLLVESINTKDAQRIRDFFETGDVEIINEEEEREAGSNASVDT
jgi:excinuclease ABC subunit C